MAGSNVSDWQDVPIDDWQDVPQIGMGESALRGVGQGLSFGLADELTGAGEAALNKLSGDEKDFLDLYRKHRDESRANYKAAEEANPYTYGAGQLTGGAGTALISGGTSIPALAAQGLLQGVGSSNADLTQGDVGGIAKDAAIGGAIGGAAGLISKIPVGKMAENLANSTSESLAGLADRFRLNSTGATGAQASKFAPDAGRRLKPYIGFGDSQEDILNKLVAAKNTAENNIDTALTQLDEKGVKVNAEDILDVLRNDIKKANSISSTRKLGKQLENIKDEIVDTAADTGAMEISGAPIPISEAEVTKRGYGDQINNWADPVAGKAAKSAYHAYKNLVEQEALKADPALGKIFKEAKETYGLLDPIQEAAERRFLTTRQSPLGGTLDTVSAGVGMLKGGNPVIGASTAIGRRLISPRIASSASVISDKLSDVVRQAPEMLGKFAKPLQEAAARGGNSLAATHFILQQTDPEYRALVNKSEDETGQDQDQ